MTSLDPTKRYPMVLPDGTVIKQCVHLNQVIKHPRIEIGAFTYSGHLQELDDYAAYLAPYLFPLSPERLVIGKFCQIAHGVRFITSSANHNTSGFSTYPFNNFTMTPETTQDEIQAMLNLPGRKGDTIVGNDVWIGMNATIMPGVTIADGTIVAAHALVTQDTEPYTLVGGNPACKLKKRFDDDVIKVLLEVRWWDWPIETIRANIDAITGADLDDLLAAAQEHSSLDHSR